MHLRSVSIKKFRNIVDSGVIKLDDKLTCLVGLNEAGKTSILRALHLIKPHDAAMLDETTDYPRWIWKRDQRSDDVGAEPTVRTVFELDDSDVEALAGLGAVLATREATVSRWFGKDQPVVELHLAEKEVLARLVDTLDEPTAALRELATKTGGKLGLRLEKQKTPADNEARHAELDTLISGLNRVTQAAADLVWTKVPTFFYFDDYALLPGRIELTELEGTEGIASSRKQTARALLSLADTTPTDLASADYEDRKAELEAVSADLTDQIFEYWKQNTDLRVQFDIDIEPAVRDAYNNPGPARRWLEIRVEDTSHRFTSNFERRSHGFQWFFSFLAAFTEFELQHQDKDFVVLLDEPGVSLHGLAQRDLLRFLNERLGSAVPVVYTTHSPFMVETDHIERVRIVEDKGRDAGATVTSDVLSVSDNSLFPLQSALGYDASQHLFVGRDNVAVEGASDVVYLTVLSQRASAADKTALDSRWSLIPTGGANNLPAFVALLGSRVEVTVIMDSGTEGAGKVQAALTAGRISNRRLIQVGDILNRTHADIEDLFTVADYLRLFNATFVTTYTETDLGPGDRIVKRLEKPHGKFDHYEPANALLRTPDLVDQLSDVTLNNFAALFAKINTSRRR
ncbi:AAA family ATPase (plasmid) [Gordonia hongkongensis]|uniref:AAA family ATPase n=1 Tax=Gordonia hongkongensis TaxID=1701090 RepID=UPI0030CEE244